MPTKSGVAQLQDVKQGVTLFYVWSVPNADGKRTVGNVCRYRVTKRELQAQKITETLRDWRIYYSCTSSIWSEGLFHSDGFATDMGIHPKGRLWIRDVGTKCFLSYRRAEAYRKRLLLHPQSARETRDAFENEELLRKMNSWRTKWA